MRPIRIWEQSDLCAALAACDDAGLRHQANRIAGSTASSDRLAQAAKTLAFHIATDRGSPAKIRALRAVVAYARRQGVGARMLRMIGVSWMHAAERMDSEGAATPGMGALEEV